MATVAVGDRASSDALADKQRPCKKARGRKEATPIVFVGRNGRPLDA